MRALTTQSSSLLPLPFLVIFLGYLVERPQAQTVNFGTGPCDDCDIPGHFCDIDNECRPFSCSNFYEYGDRQLTGYSPDGTTLQCFGYSTGDQDNAHGVIYGCDPVFPFVTPTPGKQVTQPFNRRCTAEREGGFLFECYEFSQSETVTTDFDFFEQESESSFPDCGEGQSPQYYYMIATSNHYVGEQGLQGPPIVSVSSGSDIDGDTIWQTNPSRLFNQSMALLSMYANVVGGPRPETNETEFCCGGGHSNIFDRPGEDDDNDANTTNTTQSMLDDDDFEMDMINDTSPNNATINDGDDEGVLSENATIPPSSTALVPTAAPVSGGQQQLSWSFQNIYIALLSGLSLQLAVQLL